ncbi:sulfatase-like hydrolase/transferase [Verrucomicrobiaceae bacterium N1E253]|uniref:Sulfatase-like hydrolase/transferase n=1 Tax=Oceaniferula marina TaxID=2748318 RepID=A0A851GEL0_9BACT|nr:sulfatase-like hydrolase/transferase [Oceaniferula marina]NWK55856.1 sulfatase-like hydrolase/transferase [Oceaniferula marina]
MIRLFLCSSVLTGACLAASPETSPKPNIVYFYADDLGWGTLKANNPESKLITPTIDSLVDTGINFTRGYGCMVCSPARSSQQTGFHQGHTWTDRNDPAATKAIRAEDIALGTVLQEAGYRTAYYGKWGYGGDYTKVDPKINNPQTIPINHGYDELLAELHHKRAHTFFQPTLWRNNTSDPSPKTTLVPNSIKPNQPLRPNYPAYQDDKDYPKTAYADDSYAIAALDFVRAQAQTKQPFFVTLAFQIPHTPLGNIASMPKWFDAYADVKGAAKWDAPNKQFAAMVTRMDAHMKNILDALEDPNGDGDTSDSVRDNTLIIFASDNGGQGGKPYKFFKTNGILSGAKGSVKEGGIRVPTVMNWRGTIKPGQSSDMPTDVTDIMPTLAELAEVASPVGTDGVSIAPTITGKGVQRQREFLTHEAGSKWTIIRGNIKLHNTGKMYDLAKDPGEKQDISGKNAKLAAEMKALAAGEFAGADDLMANSFRTWQGKDGSAFERESSWSKPAYPKGHELANDYSENTPNPRWNAVMINTTKKDSRTTLAEDTSLLALEVGGNRKAGNSQTLVVPKGLTLTGRNEIRISEQGSIELDGGTLNTLRWVDVHPGGHLSGSGAITGHLYHSGELTITSSSGAPNVLKVGKDLYQMQTGVLSLEFNSGAKARLEVQGKASLSGTLALRYASGFKPKEGDETVIIQASAISGRFQNKQNQLVVGGDVYQIKYGPKSVTVQKLASDDSPSP